ncbi:MAG: phosphopyruvate hydratase [Christensenellales bacterium]
MKLMKIEKIHAREILDSRATPTLEAEVWLQDGSVGRAAVPSGASTGALEAIELRDKEKKRYDGKGVKQAVENVNTKIAGALCGYNAYNQAALDNKMIELDGSPNKKNLGANAILGVSMALARAAANSLHQPLYRYLGGVNARKLPMPMMNILNGGAHADNGLDFQEFMIVPVGAACFSDALEMCVNVYKELKQQLKGMNLSTGLGDEGGFAPDLHSPEAAMELIIAAIRKCHYEEGKDIALALDVAASQLQNKEGSYHVKGWGELFDAEAMAVCYKKLCAQYPVISIEDPLGEEDWQGFQLLGEQLPGIQIVGDDLFVTNEKRLKEGIKRKAANAILLKLNQAGTLTETMAAAETAKQAGFRTVVSHRSGETADTFIADLAVALGAMQIKTGAPARAERTEKYNRLLRIEEELGDSAIFRSPYRV